MQMAQQVMTRIEAVGARRPSIAEYHRGLRNEED